MHILFLNASIEKWFSIDEQEFFFDTSKADFVQIKNPDFGGSKRVTRQMLHLSPKLKKCFQKLFSFVVILNCRIQSQIVQQQYTKIKPKLEKYVLQMINKKLIWPFLLTRNHLHEEFFFRTIWPRVSQLEPERATLGAFGESLSTRKIKVSSTLKNLLKKNFNFICNLSAVEGNAKEEDRPPICELFNHFRRNDYSGKNQSSKRMIPFAILLDLFLCLVRLKAISVSEYQSLTLFESNHFKSRKMHHDKIFSILQNFYKKNNRIKAQLLDYLTKRINRCKKIKLINGLSTQKYSFDDIDLGKCAQSALATGNASKECTDLEFTKRLNSLFIEHLGNEFDFKQLNSYFFKNTEIFILNDDYNHFFILEFQDSKLVKIGSFSVNQLPISSRVSDSFLAKLKNIVQIVNLNNLMFF